MSNKNIGLIGLGVMGQNLALNIVSKGFSLSGFDLDKTKLALFSKKIEGKNIFLADSYKNFVDSLESPKKILIMVPAGSAVDSVINNILPFLSVGDIIIDGGNSYFGDTIRRINELTGKGILYVGTGISGGEEGALKGPSIMPGGNFEAWKYIKPILQSIAAKTEDGLPCCEWIGSGGAGHFVKMVHNGIEYADMQMISEAYYLMDNLLNLSTDEMQQIFLDWNKGELKSYLIEITADIFGVKDIETGKPLIDLILDTAEQKGTGKWTGQTSLDLGAPAMTITDAVFIRMLSSLKNERVEASKVLSGPTKKVNLNKNEFIEMIRKALFCSKICSYAQGFQLLKIADNEYKWELNFGNIALLWRAGCIIRAQFLTKIRDAYLHQPDIKNLLLDNYFASIIKEYQDSWRKVISVACEYGIPVPAFMSALSYYDCYRSEVLPANLLQAQRDYFGAHTYKRIDKEGIFHTEWK
ncbi:MAG TPA: NADP-dependent phosphogluconate dehydrogenase [Ignavibacteria bacterium]